MWTGFEAAQREYENMNPYDNEVSDPWDDNGTPSEVMQYLFDEGRVHECIADYLYIDNADMDEDRAADLLEMIWKKGEWIDWFESWMKRSERSLREGFNKWWRKYNDFEEG